MTGRAAKAVAIVAVAEIVALCATVCIHVQDAAEPPYTLPAAYREYWAGLEADELAGVLESLRRDVDELCDRLSARLADLAYVLDLATARPPP